MAEVAASIVGLTAFGTKIVGHLYRFGCNVIAAREQTARIGDCISDFITISNVLTVSNTNTAISLMSQQLDVLADFQRSVAITPDASTPQTMIMNRSPQLIQSLLMEWTHVYDPEVAGSGITGDDSEVRELTQQFNRIINNERLDKLEAEAKIVHLEEELKKAQASMNASYETDGNDETDSMRKRAINFNKIEEWFEKNRPPREDGPMRRTPKTRYTIVDPADSDDDRASRIHRVYYDGTYRRRGYVSPELVGEKRPAQRPRGSTAQGHTRSKPSRNSPAEPKLHRAESSREGPSDKYYNSSREKLYAEMDEPFEREPLGYRYSSGETTDIALPGTEPFARYNNVRSRDFAPGSKFQAADDTTPRRSKGRNAE